jgi:hypothetical protein
MTCLSLLPALRHDGCTRLSDMTELYLTCYLEKVANQGNSFIIFDAAAT